MCLVRQVLDIETGFNSTLLNLNPDGWINGVTTEKSWRMLYGMDVAVERQLIIAGAPPCIADTPREGAPPRKAPPAGISYSAACCTAVHSAHPCAGDSHGRVHFVDARAPELAATCQLHKKGNKVNSVHVNPRNCNLLLTGSNDWTARLCDIRCMSSSVGPSGSGVCHPRPRPGTCNEALSLSAPADKAGGGEPLMR